MFYNFRFCLSCKIIFVLVFLMEIEYIHQRIFLSTLIEVTLAKPHHTSHLPYLQSASFQAIRRPLPPPPADALIITG